MMSFDFHHINIEFSRYYLFVNGHKLSTSTHHSESNLNYEDLPQN